MVKATPAVVRSGRVLALFAANPVRPFSLTELSDRTGVNRSSLLAILSALTEVGLLDRHRTHRTYTLGPAAIALGHAALAQHPMVDVARAEIARLADEVDVECLAAVPVGLEVVIVATAGRPAAGAPEVRVGHRLPLTAPLGAVFVAWSPPADVDRWIAATGTPDDGSRWAGVLGAIRARGWAATLDSVPRRRLGEVLHERGEHGEIGPDGAVRDAVVALGSAEYQLGSVVDDRSYPVSTVVAPVFDVDSRVALAVALHGFDHPRRGNEIHHLASRLVSTVRAVTRAGHGRPPDERSGHG